jgi:predicted nucleic acid-binding protein
MILADTAIWIDYFRSGEAHLSELLADGAVLMHPYVRGEISLVNLKDRAETLEFLDGLPAAQPAEDAEVFIMIERQALFGCGIGFVDAHLLAAARMAPPARLWTRDKRLAALADRLSIGFRIPS